MPLRWQGFAVPKRGNTTDEYEDAFAGNPRAGRFAVADGASESSFACLWAKLLVEGFAHPAPKSNGGTHWLEPLRQRWAAEVEGLDLPWYAEAKRTLGASATFLGLILKRSANMEGGRWLALAVGDCCCFQIHKNLLVRAFPKIHSRDFDNHPRLLNSRSEGNRLPQRDQQRGRGKWRPGDRFLLMTDALAHWLLSRLEEEAQPWQAIASVLTQEQPDQAFLSWIERIRDQSGLRNDDVTLVVIDL